MSLLFFHSTRVALAKYALLLLILTGNQKGFGRKYVTFAYAKNAVKTNDNDKWLEVAAKLLASADALLAKNDASESISLYLRGIQSLPDYWSGEKFRRILNWDQDNAVDSSQTLNPDGDAAHLPSSKEMEVILSMYTNYGTALSVLEGSTEKVRGAYQTSCLMYRHFADQRKIQKQDSSKNDLEIPEAVKKVATQSFFFLGMTVQDLSSTVKENQQQYLESAARAYAAATELDRNHWSSFANMGVVLADVGVDGSGNRAISLEMYDEGIMAYLKAIEILIGDEEKSANNENSAPTDPPENAREVVAELYYRIGLCLVPLLFTPIASDAEDGHKNGGIGVENNKDYGSKHCTLILPQQTEGEKSKPITRSCLELSAHQFHTALQFNPHHEGSINALALITADATFGMSTDIKYVQNLFENYASDFEYSLVKELRYDGFHRLRSGFDRAMTLEYGSNNKKKFSLVIDAGCGTGLAGEHFRNISHTLIGVDLSSTMVDRAKQSRPGLYDNFQTGDIKQILHKHAQTNQQSVNLLVAADTFIYFNELSGLFASIEAGLEEGGYAVFSLENVSLENEKRLQKLKPDWKWQLAPSGRIAHRKEYVQNVAMLHSLKVVVYENFDNFRHESGVGVRGHMFVLKKSSDNEQISHELEL